MKKRFLASILLLAMMTMMCCGCDNSTTATKISSYKEIDAGFTRIDDAVVYDNKTQIVYYLFGTTSGYAGFGYMSPYISENGNFCRYSDGQIVEIVK